MVARRNKRGIIINITTKSLLEELSLVVIDPEEAVVLLEMLRSIRVSFLKVALLAYRHASTG